MNIILCGMPGSGKSTVGQALAEKAGWEFVDTDSLIEALAKQSCRELYKESGEEVFRLTEKQAIAQLADRTNAVIATGGGALLLGQNVTLLKTLGLLVYLEAASEDLYSRISAKGPPAYLDPEDPELSFRRLVRQRSPIFETWCDVAIPVEGLTPVQIAEIIWEQYGQ